MASPHSFEEKHEKPHDGALRGYEGGDPGIDPAKERKLIRKLDLHIIPVVMLLYLLSFLDR